MAKYEDTIKDIEKTLGIIPGFMKALPKDVLIQEWPLFKTYNFTETKIPGKYRELMGLAVAANIKCPYCQLFHKGAAQMNGATEEELAEQYSLQAILQDGALSFMQNTTTTRHSRKSLNR